MVAMGPQSVRKSSCLGYLRRISTSCLIFFFVASIASAGSWAVYDFGRDAEIKMMTDDRDGGVWVALEIKGDSFDTWLVHVCDSGALEWVAPPDGWQLGCRSYYVESVLWCQQSRLMTALHFYQPSGHYDRSAVWDYDGIAWNLALDPASVLVPYYWNAIDWVRVTSDSKWSAGFAWTSGDSCPQDHAAMINLVGGQLVEVDTAEVYRQYFPGFNDGASWVESLLGYSRSWKRIDWTGTTKDVGGYDGCIAITPHGTWLQGDASWPPGTGYRISESSFARGLVWEAELGGSGPERMENGHRAVCRAPFRMAFYMIYEGQLCQLARGSDGWRFDTLSPLPAELAQMGSPSLTCITADSAGNVWVAIEYISGRGPHNVVFLGWALARYDRSDELIDPTITLTVGLDVIEPGDTTVVNASIAPGQRRYDADLYAVVQTPTGELWSYPWTEHGIHPMAENLHFDPHTFVSDFILLHIEPPMPLAFGLDGQYTVYVALTEPGTLNPIGEIAYVPFELALAR